MPNVTVIPATIQMHTKAPTLSQEKRKVAGYARVSTDSDEQFTSYTAQVNYYTDFIRAHADWEFVGVYTDEGVSGLGTKNRDGFNRMIEDALAGKINLIVTKSVSRFARNTVDSLTTIRKLKEHGVEVYFEKENILTFDAKGELLITLMSSLAQEESRSISENVTWGQRKRMADGKVTLPYKHFLGYRKGTDGLPEIVPEEAELVRRIYRMFMEGKSVSYIARTLTDEGVPTPAGKQKWQPAVVTSILLNEKYKGSALLQKRFTVDFLTKKMKMNEGEVPQYFVEESHPAIIDPAEWDQVQIEMRRRKQGGAAIYSSSTFSGKIICGDCGGVYGAKVWHSTDEYRRVIWQCNRKFHNERKCQTPHLTEEEIKIAFSRAVSILIDQRDQLLEDGRLLMDELADTAEIEEKLQSLSRQKTIVAGLVEKCVKENAATPQDQTAYRKKYQGLTQEYEELQRKEARCRKEWAVAEEKSIAIAKFLFEITELDLLETCFSESRWNAMVDHVVVHRDKNMVFVFNNGKEVVV